MKFLSPSALFCGVLVAIGCSQSAPANGVNGAGGTMGGSAPAGGSSGIGGAPAGGSAGTSMGGTGLGGNAGLGGGAGVAGSAGAGALGGTAGLGGSAGTAGSAGAGGTSGGSAGAGGSAAEPHWVGTWGTAPQLTEDNNEPPMSLSNNTLRQIFYVSIGGSNLRLHLSNEYGASPLEITEVRIANFANGNAIDSATDTQLQFLDAPTLTLPAGQTATSDPFDYALMPMSQVAVSIAFGNTPGDITGHPGSRTTSFIAAGNAASAQSLSNPTPTDHWYYVTGIDVLTETSPGAVVILGDSITDGRGSTTNGNDRWPDAFSRRLRMNPDTAEVAVLNMGIGGNAVVTGGLGPTALTRFDRDIIQQAGARWVIVLIGVNDIGESTGDVADDVIAGFGEMVTAARDAGLTIYGSPILPFAGSFYDTDPARQTMRDEINAWVRAPGSFDAVIDLDAAVRNPSQPAQLLGMYDEGDQLHLNPTGYSAMADAIEFSLFSE